MRGKDGRMVAWPRELTEVERSVILADQIERFASDGWRVLHQTPTTAQLTRPKRLSVVAALFWLLLCGVGLLVYLLIYADRRDPIVRLTVASTGMVQGDFGTDDDAWPNIPGDRRCPVCVYPNMARHTDCQRCGQTL